MEEKEGRQKHKVYLYCWNPECNKIMELILNGKEKYVRCPKCGSKNVSAQPDPNNCIQLHFEKLVIKEIRKTIRKDYKKLYESRKMMRCFV